MRKGIVIAMAALGLVLGSLSFPPAAHAVYAPSGHAAAWVDEPNG